MANGSMIITTTLLGKPPCANKPFHIVNPFAYLDMAYRQAGAFHDMCHGKLRECPSTMERPWDLVRYADEVVPGNQLSDHNTRQIGGSLLFLLGTWDPLP